MCKLVGHISPMEIDLGITYNNSQKVSATVAAQPKMYYNDFEM